MLAKSLRTDGKRMTLRRAVIAFLCLVVINGFFVDVLFHAAHGSVGHVHGANDASHESVVAAADHDGHEDGHERAGHSHHVSDDGSTAAHQPCDHAHCCVSCILPTGFSVSLPLPNLRRFRSSNNRLAGLRSPSFDRPPIAYL